MTQLDIYIQAAEAWIALVQHRPRRALIAMRAAADREDRTEKNVAMENRLSPMRELLGEMLLEAGRPDEAQREFDASLQTIPNRYRSLAGAARAAGLLRHEQDARAYKKCLLALTQNADSKRLAMLAARAYVNNHGSPR